MGEQEPTQDHLRLTSVYAGKLPTSAPKSVGEIREFGSQCSLVNNCCHSTFFSRILPISHVCKAVLEA